MRKLFASLLLGAASLLWSAQGMEKPFYEKARPERRIQIGTQKHLQLAKGKNNLEIVVDAGAYQSTRFAAEELQHFLSRLLAVPVPIVAQPTEGKISLIVGINRFSREAGLDEAKFCRDAFVIKTDGNRIFILGKDDPKVDTRKVVKTRDGGGTAGLLHERGTLFGVYDFLERFCGIRFYHANDLFTIIPEVKTVSIPQIDIYDRPDYESRYYSIFDGKLEDNAAEHGWAPNVFFSPGKALNYIRFRCETRRVPDCHGLTYLFYIQRFSKAHPEYFALHTNGRRYFEKSMPHTGQLCFSSGIMDEIFEDAKAILSGDKEQIRARSPYFFGKWGHFASGTAHTPGFVFNFMPQDAYYHCRCGKCIKHMATPQTISNFLWGKAVDLALRLKAAGVKGYVSTMAYPPCHLPPENLELPDNMIVMVAQNGAWDPADVQARNYKAIQDWNLRSRQNKVWMWNYICKVPSRNLVLPGVPCSTPRAVGAYYKTLKNDINGAFLESGSTEPSEHYTLQVLDYYVFGKVTWNNDTDVDALLKEYFRLCYGAAAPEMESISQQIETLWLTRIGGKTIMNNLGPMNIPPSDNELWNQIYNRERLDRIESEIRKAETKLKNDSKALARVKYFTEATIRPLRKQFDLYQKRSDSISRFRVGLSEESPAVVYLQPLKSPGKAFPKTKVTAEDLGDRLKFTFDCEEPNMADVIAAKREKDDSNIWQDNEIEIVLNPSGDRLNYYHWMINSAGSFYDASCRKVGAKSVHDSKWDSACEYKVETTENGWKAVLTLDRKKYGTWNPEGFVVNFSRSRVLKNQAVELYSWSPFLVNGFHELERFGRIVPLKNLPGNIVRNGDFQAKNWPAWGKWQKQYIKSGEKREQDFQTFVFADKSLKLAYDGRENRGISVGQTLYKLVPCKKYRLTYYVKLENVVPLKRGGGACLQIWNTKKNFWFPLTRLTGTMPWTLQTFEFQSLPDSDPKTTGLNCCLFFASGTAWFDGITLEEIP